MRNGRDVFTFNVEFKDKCYYRPSWKVVWQCELFSTNTHGVSGRSESICFRFPQTTTANIECGNAGLWLVRKIASPYHLDTADDFKCWRIRRHIQPSQQHCGDCMSCCGGRRGYMRVRGKCDRGILTQKRHVSIYIQFSKFYLVTRFNTKKQFLFPVIVIKY